MKDSMERGKRREADREGRKKGREGEKARAWQKGKEGKVNILPLVKMETNFNWNTRPAVLLQNC